MTPTRVAILGSTGSIGTQTLAIAREHPDRFAICGLQAHRRAAELSAQAREFAVPDLCLSDPAAEIPKLGTGARCHQGADGLLRMLEAAAPDVVVNGITGAAGLQASEWTLRNGRRLALANKESMVLAGGYLMALARHNGGSILPVDSEHCALHQCLRAGSRHEVKRVWLTGSGGPFRRRDPATFASITPAEALRHPTWTMGPRITIGSATMMNKAFEVVEAHWLFDLRPEQIEVVIHPQSIVHSMVEFVDGSIVAQCGVPDMRVPILYCLGWPDRLPLQFAPFDPLRWARLEFEPLDQRRYPAVALAYDVLRRGGDSGALLNAADEELTQLFLAGAIPFPAITAIASTILHARSPHPVDDLAAVAAADGEGRAEARRLARDSAPVKTTGRSSGPDDIADE